MGPNVPTQETHAAQVIILLPRSSFSSALVGRRADDWWRHSQSSANLVASTSMWWHRRWLQSKCLALLLVFGTANLLEPTCIQVILLLLNIRTSNFEYKLAPTNKSKCYKNHHHDFDCCEAVDHGNHSTTPNTSAIIIQCACRCLATSTSTTAAVAASVYQRHKIEKDDQSNDETATSCNSTSHGIITIICYGQQH